MKENLQPALSDQVSTDQLDDASRNGVSNAAQPMPLPSVTVGRVVSLAPGSAPLVDFPANDSGELVPARSIVALTQLRSGNEVTLAFEDGDITQPIILGTIQTWDDILTKVADPIEPLGVASIVEVHRDRETLLLTAEREITLSCGKSSITLTSAGKLLLRGAYLLSRSSGVNRIKGGSVQIN